MNRNVTEEHKFSREEIQAAFLKTNYEMLNQREKIVYSKFFKECDEEDLINLVNVFELSQDNIKSVYEDIPERAFSGVTEIWDKEFKLENKK